MGTEIFGKSWEEHIAASYGTGSIIQYEDKQIGKFWITTNALPFNWDIKNNYRIYSLIYEKTIEGMPILICLKKEIDVVQDWNGSKVTIHTIDNVLNDFPKNIIEIQQRALLNIYREYPRYGQLIQTINTYQLFAENDSELFFIATIMESKNFLDIDIKLSGNNKSHLAGQFSIAENGWIEIENLIKNKYSKQAFIAMWFDPSMDSAFKSIERALNDLGLSVMRIDRKQHNNEISGEILTEINNSNIIIADVTKQRNGVYFEAGYAMGQKKKVIWCCREDDLKNVHFDTRQYNHVVWKNEEDLYLKMKDRVLGTIALT